MIITNVLNYIYTYSQKATRDFDYDEFNNGINLAISLSGEDVNSTKRLYEILDSVFYNFDFSKVRPEICNFLLRCTDDIKSNLGFRKSFLQDCRQKYRGHNNYHQLFHWEINE